MRRIFNLLRSKRRRMEQDLDRELRYHTDRRAEDLMKSGVDETEARRQAALEFGGVAQVREEVRDTWVSRWFHELMRDIQYAGRTLRRNPGFTSVALLSLALGIGANAAIFGLFHAVLVRPLPYKDPDRLLSLMLVTKSSPAGFVFTPEFVAWRASSRDFEELTAWNDEQFNLTGAGSPERVIGASVTANFLPLLGVQPALGRNFSSADGNVGPERAAILTHDLWQRHFGSDPLVVGRAVMLNDQPCTVIGVLPPGFRFPGDLRPDILVDSRFPVQPHWGAQAVGMLHVIGRLREDVTKDRALAELSSITSRYETDMPGWLREHRKEAMLRAVPLQERLVGDTRAALLVLLGAVGLLLLIACVNVANLQLGRAALRRREIGLRAALGASPGRIARSLVIENLMLAVLAGIAGFFVASALLSGLRLFPGLPLWDRNDLHVSWTLGAAALVLSTLSGLAIGLVPALVSPHVDLNDVLKTGSRSLVGGRGSGVRSILVSAQVALALILLLGSGLFLRSLYNVLAVHPGFESRGVITARLNLPGSRYPSDSHREAFGRAVIDAVRALPGVVDAAISNTLPLTRYTLGVGFVVEGQPEPSPGERPGAPVLTVSPEYFRAMGIPLLAGRGFEERDNENGPRVVIVNRSFAKRFFSSEDVVGKRIRFGPSPDWATIVGVAGDVRHGGREREAEPELFVPGPQMPSPPQRVGSHRVSLVVRTKTNPSSLAPSLRSAVWEVDKDLPVYDVATMEERLKRSGETRTAQTLLLASFALLAMCLAAIGVYGVVSEAVHQRTGEIGLRMALGAEGRDVRRMVMKRSLALVIAGIATGSIASLWLLRYIASLLYGVEPADAGTFVAVGLGLLLVALLAGYLPARRASRIDPLVALRCE
jgi:putative ABC transport system permease protein